MSFQIEIDKLIKEKRLYFVGDALPPDWYAAFKVWLPMAQAGDPKAQYNIGRCYNRGDGVDQDRKQAEYWYLKAAEQNDPRALLNLYLFYSDEKKTEAENYLERAVLLGETRALGVMSARAEEKKAQQQVAKSKDFLQVNQDISDLLAPLFSERKFDEAKQKIAAIKDERILWVREYLDYMDIEIISVNHTTLKFERYIKNGGYIGTVGPNGGFTATPTHDVEKYKSHKAIIEIKNNSARNLSIKFFNESEKFYPAAAASIKSGGTEIVEISGPATLTHFEPNCYEGEQFKDYKYTDNHSKNGLINKFHVMVIDGKSVSYKKREMRFGLKDKIVINETERRDCFVLTACYGDGNHPTVKTFRNFRDEFLLNNTLGKRFVRMYYIYGPVAANAIRNKPHVRMILRLLFASLEKLLPQRYK